VCELGEFEQNEVVRIFQNKSISVPEIRQNVIDSLRDVEFDVCRGDLEEVMLKLEAACKHATAWKLRYTASEIGP